MSYKNFSLPAVDQYALQDDAASRLTETTKELPSSPAWGSEPVRKVLTRADIEKINKGTHSCGWTTGAVKNPNPACGCMCGTVYASDGRAILSHSGRHGMRCQHADERGNLLVPTPLGDISGPKGSGGAAPEAADELDAMKHLLRDYIDEELRGGLPYDRYSILTTRAMKLLGMTAPPPLLEQWRKELGLPPAAPIAPAAQELRRALAQAAQSLHTIAEQAGRDEGLRNMEQVRGYAYSRALAADDLIARYFAARAERKDGEAKHG